LNSRTFIIPVEIQNREMLAKLYLGAVAVTRGYEVVVGDQKEIARRVFELKPGIYLDKSSAKTKRILFGKLRKLGYVPVVICEEGLVYRNTNRYLHERIDPDTLLQAHIFYCWGEKQQNDILTCLPDTHSLRVTGNPRFDLLRPEFRSIWMSEAAQHVSRWGRFILVNTNFSRFNRLPGTADVIELLKTRGTLAGVEGVDYYRGLVQRLGDQMQAFLQAIPEISRHFPEHAVIVRPHPGEDVTPYRVLEAGNSHIHVINEGSVAPWLLAADAIVHNSCTTGVEGWLLNRPVISYTYGGDSFYDSQLPTELSYKVFSLSELIDQLHVVITGGIGAKHDPRTLKIAVEYMHGLSGPMAADQLVEQLPDIPSKSPVVPLIQERLLGMARRWLRKTPGLRMPEGLAMLAKQKFPGFDEQDAQRFVEKLAQCRPELSQVSINRMAGWKNVFHMTRQTSSGKG
jgi:surface carbohydrate biosynthesis protein